MPTLGEQLKALRVKKGMTQEQLAQKLNTTKAAISRYEKDQRQPRLEQISEIARIVDASPDELFDLLFICPNITQEKEYDSGAEYLKYLSRYVNDKMPELIQSLANEDWDGWLTSFDSPFIFYNYNSEGMDIAKRLLKAFLMLDRKWQKELVEDAETYLDFQKKRNAKTQQLEQQEE